MVVVYVVSVVAVGCRVVEVYFARMSPALGSLRYVVVVVDVVLTLCCIVVEVVLGLR